MKRYIFEGENHLFQYVFLTVAYNLRSRIWLLNHPIFDGLNGLQQP